MPGVVIIVLILVLAFPVAFLMSMSIVAAVLGWSVGGEVDEKYAGTEELELANN
ncbi:MAG: hypothetical protein RLZZ31_457 [Actinomycetota bacterium]|jgi:hypothetical protein